MFKFIEDVPDQLIILEQLATHGPNPKALVQCPICGAEFLKRRDHIREQNRTWCWACITYATRKFIENTEQIIILEQVADYDRHNKPRALVRCPSCGHEFLRDRTHIRQCHHTLCASCSKQGERAHQWKGGISFDYGLDWPRAQEFVLERDRWTCRLCGATSCRLDVHHVTPWRKSHNNSPDNLILLCQPCHAWADWHLDESVSLLYDILDWG